MNERERERETEIVKEKDSKTLNEGKKERVKPRRLKIKTRSFYLEFIISSDFVL